MLFQITYDLLSLVVLTPRYVHRLVNICDVGLPFDAQVSYIQLYTFKNMPSPAQPWSFSSDFATSFDPSWTCQWLSTLRMVDSWKNWVVYTISACGCCSFLGSIGTITNVLKQTSNLSPSLSVWFKGCHIYFLYEDCWWPLFPSTLPWNYFPFWLVKYQVHLAMSVVLKVGSFMPNILKTSSTRLWNSCRC